MNSTLWFNTEISLPVSLKSMLHVISAISGEELAVLNLQSAASETSVEVLKEQLAPILGVSKYRQRLLLEDNTEFQLLDISGGTPNVQLVILEFLPPALEHEKQVIDACKNDDHTLLQSYLEEPRNPDLPITFVHKFKGMWPLHIAVHHGSLQCIHLLLDANANINPRDANGGRTPLDIAAEHGQMEVIRCLIEARADVNKSDIFDATPLQNAAIHGHMEVVRFLIEAGADKDRSDIEGFKPLQIAAGHGHLDVVRFLTEVPADKDKSVEDDLSTSLQSAARNGHIEIVRFLIEVGADKDKPDINGKTPVQAAVAHGHTEVASFLSALAQKVGKAETDLRSGVFVSLYSPKV